MVFVKTFLFILFIDKTFAFVLPLDLNSYLKRNGNKNFNPLIVGGTDAQLGDAPYQVSLQRYESHRCGASIISSNWILTAAHCVDGEDVKTLSIRYGSLYHASGGQVVDLSEVVTHPLFSVWTLDNDIALMRTTRPLHIGTDTTQAIALPDQDSDIAAGQLVSITGWGLTEENGSVSPNLKKISIPVVDRSVCRKRFEDYSEVTDNMICAGIAEGGIDSCQGDSGGPVVSNGVLVGAVSWGYEQTCARPNYYGVYTRIAKYRDWIRIKTFI